MKRILNNPNVWQKKRDELPVNGDPQMDWLQMQAMLDRAMPVSAPASKSFRFRHTKWWIKGLIVTTSAIVIYAAVQLYVSNKHNVLPAGQQHSRRDSIAPPVKNMPSLADSGKSNAVKDSSFQQKPVKSPYAVSLPKNPKDSAAERIPGGGDSTKNTHNTNSFRNIDSLLSPSGISPVKTAHDSVKLPTINNRTIPKDTARGNKKPPGKKHKPRVNIFT